MQIVWFWEVVSTMSFSAPPGFKTEDEKEDWCKTGKVRRAFRGFQFSVAGCLSKYLSNCEPLAGLRYSQVTSRKHGDSSSLTPRNTSNGQQHPRPRSTKQRFCFPKIWIWCSTNVISGFCPLPWDGLQRGKPDAICPTTEIQTWRIANGD